MAAPLSKWKYGERAIESIENTPPILILGIMSFMGIVLTLVSTSIHLDTVYFPQISKKLGYLHEINWAMNFSFVVPIAVFFAIASLNCIVQVIRNLGSAQMLVHANGDALTERELMESYHRMAGLARKPSATGGCVEQRRVPATPCNARRFQNNATSIYRPS
jgi:hypothetical protein